MLNAAKTGKKIADIITDSGASPEMKRKIIQMWTDIMDAIYTDIKSDSQITVAAGIPTSTLVPSPNPTTPFPGVTTSTGTATIS